MTKTLDFLGKILYNKDNGRKHMKLLKFSLPTGRDIYINADNVTTVAQDPLDGSKVEIYTADGIRYLFKHNLEELLGKLNGK